MKIIDNKKDYYDYLSGIYGIDELIVFDRRNSKMLKSLGTLPPGMEECFNATKLEGDRPKEAKTGWNVRSYHDRNETEKNDLFFSRKTFLEGRVFHFILEVGSNQYCFEVERWLNSLDNNEVCLDYWLLKSKYDIKSRFFDSPIGIAPCQLPYRWRGPEIDWEKQDVDMDRLIVNPILSGTYITKLIPPEEIWKAIYELLSSQKEKPIIDTRSDIQKLESAGFDKKISFRK